MEGVLLRGRMRLLPHCFKEELQLVAALARGYESMALRQRWLLLTWLCDEAGETAQVRTEVEQRVSLGKVFYNLQVQEKLLVNRPIMDNMEPPMTRVLTAVKALLMEDARALQISGGDGLRKAPSRKTQLSSVRELSASNLDAGGSPTSSVGPASARTSQVEDDDAEPPTPVPAGGGGGKKDGLAARLGVVHQKLLGGSYETAAKAEADVRACFDDTPPVSAAVVGKKGGSGTRAPAGAKSNVAILALLNTVLSEDGEGTAGGGWMGPLMRTKPLGRDRINRQYWWFGWPQGWLAIEALPLEMRHEQGERVVPTKVQVESRARKASRGKERRKAAASKVRLDDDMDMDSPISKAPRTSGVWERGPAIYTAPPRPLGSGPSSGWHGTVGGAAGVLAAGAAGVLAQVSPKP